jgi:DNA invertase Pin-like site-specific DNA recombinase
MVRGAYTILSEEVKRHIIDDLQRGRSAQEVGRSFNVPRSTVYNIWNHFNIHGDVYVERRHGRRLRM